MFWSLSSSLSKTNWQANEGGSREHCDSIFFILQNSPETLYSVLVWVEWKNGEIKYHDSSTVEAFSNPLNIKKKSEDYEA